MVQSKKQIYEKYWSITLAYTDINSKFYPEEVIEIKGKKEKWYRQDPFESEKDMWEYLKVHFGILRKEIKGAKNASNAKVTK